MARTATLFFVKGKNYWRTSLKSDLKVINGWPSLSLFSVHFIDFDQCYWPLTFPANPLVPITFIGVVMAVAYHCVTVR